MDRTGRRLWARCGACVAIGILLVAAGCSKGKPQVVDAEELPTVLPADLGRSTPPADSHLGQCERNLRALQLAAQFYREQKGEALDPHRWPEQIEPFRRKVAQPGESGACPGTAKGLGYALNPSAKEDGGEDWVLFFESDALSGGPEKLAYRHDECALLVTTSGDVLHVRAKGAKNPSRVSGDRMNDGTVLGKAATARW